mmetsp:Transcript_107849/g.300704  ORF Transcript_107849/g.300704 Transcript_107849/m.300704 type:complete len:189 (-) Transcript_107849:167-733(-)
MGAMPCRPTDRPETSEPVLLNVYDLGTHWGGQAINRVLRPMGMGAFHCGVEVYGMEWSYSDNERGEGNGIFQCPPRQCKGHSFYTQVPMGHTSYPCEHVLYIIELVKNDWQSSDYHALNHNCCHFSDELCHRLGVGEVPSWIMNLTDATSVCIEIRCCPDAMWGKEFQEDILVEKQAPPLGEMMAASG